MCGVTGKVECTSNRDNNIYIDNNRKRNTNSINDRTMGSNVRTNITSKRHIMYRVMIIRIIYIMVTWYRIWTIDRNVTSKFNHVRNIVGLCVGHDTSRSASNSTNARNITSMCNISAVRNTARVL